jgi:ATP-dependent Clp protease ATP-binding subunit ClpB
VNSQRYITDRFLPDKAIDLIDEAASRLRLQQESKPEVLQDLDHAILTIQIELESLKKVKGINFRDPFNFLTFAMYRRQVRLQRNVLMP